MSTLTKIMIVGLLSATTITASVAASTFKPARPVKAPHENVTVIYKSDNVWPVKHMISTDPCSIRACIEA